MWLKKLELLGAIEGHVVAFPVGFHLREQKRLAQQLDQFSARYMFPVMRRMLQTTFRT